MTIDNIITCKKNIGHECMKMGQEYVEKSWKDISIKDEKINHRR